MFSRLTAFATAFATLCAVLATASWASAATTPPQARDASALAAKPAPVFQLEPVVVTVKRAH